ncbi:ImmA/IrrE family metallo-endopeptidase [Amylibacter sp. SFDW26]|uniref:helix-turn-helix domain-containing protein n=1 Tax=Amylibacter sp. SFDW26 TaxID=2652722 RepID=UPI00126243F2|nr:XRE family transcriptional regulator [Amylibacter sp. SFDW26]KAB7615414.1 ImmA/IrrE family metallo-endopeptidase [Amylibacter sp. SFDW26]
MAQTKLYAGVSLRKIRQEFNLTQKQFADRLDISLPYLSQMENNHRPIATSVVLTLAREFNFDVSKLSDGDSQRVVADMKEALADPIFSDTTINAADLQLTASNAPTLARAFLDLHQTYRQAQERLASLDEALGREGGSIQLSPWEEVRDFFHYCDNYIDAVDRSAENFSNKLTQFDTPLHVALTDFLSDKHRITVQYSDDATLRKYDPSKRILTLSIGASIASRAFQMAHQVALLEHDELLEANLDMANFSSQEARDICKIGLANYFAGAAILPYAAFLQTAQECRHDLEILALHFGASIEQVAHRLSTMQRSGLKGIPFFFVRVDQAGTITKRHSATKLQFARFGGACPLWNVHRAFETPGQFLRQLAETPDGAQYLCLARDVSKSAGSFHAPIRRYAIGLGCEVKHVNALVYADDMDTQRSQAFEPIGISCRICERENCHQRSIPPLERRLTVDHNARGILPYSLSEK